MRILYSKRFLLALSLLLLNLLPLQGQTVAAQVTDESKMAEAELRRQAFDKVWNTINEKHYDPTFGGVDWKKVREIYAPKAAIAETRADFHAVLRQMLGELKLSHFGVFSRDIEGVNRQKFGASIGAEIKMIGGQPVIYRVDPGSTAAAAGLKPGYIVQKIDEKLTADILRTVESSFTGRKLTPGVQQLYRERTVQSFLGGAPDTVVKVTVLDEKDQPRTLDVTRKAFTGEMSQALGNFPPQEVIFESRKLASGIGYIRFNMWVIPQAAKIRAAMRELAGAKGLIVDLRGNPGGVGGLAPGMAGLMVDKQVSLGSMNTRDSEQKFIAYPQENPFPGKVVILTDHGTGSTSEVFAAGLQEIGRAVTLGETSAGAVLPSVFDTLPTGAIFQYAISDYRSPKNVLIEGRGVVPDVEVKETRDALLAGHDLPLEAAEKLILNQ